VTPIKMYVFALRDGKELIELRWVISGLTREKLSQQQIFDTKQRYIQPGRCWHCPEDVYSLPLLAHSSPRLTIVFTSGILSSSNSWPIEQ